ASALKDLRRGYTDEGKPADTDNILARMRQLKALGYNENMLPTTLPAWQDWEEDQVKGNHLAPDAYWNYLTQNAKGDEWARMLKGSNDHDLRQYIMYRLERGTDWKGTAFEKL